MNGETPRYAASSPAGDGLDLTTNTFSSSSKRIISSFFPKLYVCSGGRFLF